MLKKIHKISQKEFQPLLKTGKYNQNQFFTLVSGVLPEKTLNNKGFKCAVVTSKQVSKKAIERNRVRRRIYSIMQKNQNSLKNNGFYIFLTKKTAVKAEFSEIEQAINSILFS